MGRTVEDPKEKPAGMTYADAGVSIDAGNELVSRIKSDVKRTHRPGVLGNIGGFGGFFELPDQYKQPVLVSGADGVGTKLRLAIDLGIHDTVGIDLVAMCVNDIIVCGAEPLWFLDYFATGRLDVDQAAAVISGIAEGCVQSGAALLGGETAEMPGHYDGEDYDLAGFAVGVVEKSGIIDGSKVKSGDSLIGLASSGPHSNGYSLIRKLIQGQDLSLKLDDVDPDRSIGDVLMTPTRIYASVLSSLLAKHDIHAIAHITGGGLTENIPRVLPDNTVADVDLTSWRKPNVFSWLQTLGQMQDAEMLRTFNCGIGMVIVVGQESKNDLMRTLQEHQQIAYEIGIIEELPGIPRVRYHP